MVLVDQHRGCRGLFVTVDAGYLAANSLKIAEGGYVPLLLAACVYGLMLIWHRGSAAVAHRLEQAPVAVPDFLADLKAVAFLAFQGPPFFSRGPRTVFLP